MKKRKCSLCGAEFNGSEVSYEAPTNGAEICFDCYDNYFPEPIASWDGNCPECGKPLIENGVILQGNILLNEPAHPVARYDCPHCEVMICVELDDQEAGWAQWEKQGNKRPDRD